MDCKKCNGTGIRTNLIPGGASKCVDCMGTGIEHVKRVVKLTNGRLVTCLVPKLGGQNV